MGRPSKLAAGPGPVVNTEPPPSTSDDRRMQKAWLPLAAVALTLGSACSSHESRTSRSATGSRVKPGPVQRDEQAPHTQTRDRAAHAAASPLPTRAGGACVGVRMLDGHSFEDLEPVGDVVANAGVRMPGFGWSDSQASRPGRPFYAIQLTRFVLTGGHHSGPRFPGDCMRVVTRDGGGKVLARQRWRCGTIDVPGGGVFGFEVELNLDGVEVITFGVETERPSLLELHKPKGKPRASVRLFDKDGNAPRIGLRAHNFLAEGADVFLSATRGTELRSGSVLGPLGPPTGPVRKEEACPNGGWLIYAFPPLGEGGKPGDGWDSLRVTVEGVFHSQEFRLRPSRSSK